MNFATALANEGTITYTENGALARNTSGSALLDFFSTIGALRNTSRTRIERLFEEAYAENPLMATKILFYGRDIREGLGERKTFRILLKYAAIHHPEAIKPNISLIGMYGRYDDLYALMDTPLENNMWDYIYHQLMNDITAMNNNQPCSLLAKWLKTADASSPRTREMGIRTARSLKIPVYHYKRYVRALRKYIDVTERHMSANNWDQIDYPTVPARAMMVHRNAFHKNDHDRYMQYIQAVTRGESKINASTLYPYDIVEKYLGSHRQINYIYEDLVVEAQWKALPNYVPEGTNAIVIADTSGSMRGRPICSALGLAIYFAERNTGPYHNMWMSFSETSQIQILRGATLAQKLQNMDMSGWNMNTNLEKAFQRILNTAVKNHVPNEEMVKSIIVISDMEIDACSRSWMFYDHMEQVYRENGYDMPNVIFWNVNSRHDVFHADKNRKGVQLCGGQSPSTFKTLMESIGFTPMEMMTKVIESKRYEPIVVLTA